MYYRLRIDCHCLRGIWKATLTVVFLVLFLFTVYHTTGTNHPPSQIPTFEYVVYL